MLRVKNLEEVERILFQYDQVKVEKMPFVLFRDHLLYRRDAWILRVGAVGVIFFTNVIPSASAVFNVMFWDKRLGESRLEIIKSSLLSAFQLFELDRISAATPWRVAPMRRVLKDAGFMLEGTVRRGWPGPPVDDLVCFGMLREEQPCLAVPLPTTSLE